MYNIEMVIEYRGAFYLVGSNQDTETCWLMAKNKNVPNVKEIVALIASMKQYGCKYEHHKEAIATIRELKIGI